MRKFFDAFFHEDEEKITEKTMMTRAISTVAIMLVCLIAMTVTAYAYFSCSITVPFGVIKTANFETKVLVQEVADEGQTTSIEMATVDTTNSVVQVITSDYKAHKITGLQPGKTYQVTIMPTEMNTAEHGFAIFAAYHTDASGNKTLASSVYHTQQLGVDVAAPSGRTDVISFYLQLDKKADVVIYSHWGTSSYYGYQNVVQLAEGQKVQDLYVEQGETVTMAVTGEALEELEPTPTPMPELTPTPIPEATATPLPDATSTPAPTGDPAATSAPEATAAPTTEPTGEPTATSEPEATSAPEAQPTEAPVVSPTQAPSSETVTTETPAAENTGGSTKTSETATTSEASAISEAGDAANSTNDTSQTVE